MILKVPQLYQYYPSLKKQKSFSKLPFLNPSKILYLLLIFSFFTLSIAQVKIKERIEISPKQNKLSKEMSTTNASGYFPCGPWIGTIDLYNPWQVVWINSSYHLDVGQQAFSYQGNFFDYNNRIDSTKKYDFAVIEGKDLCYIQENYIDSINGTYIPSTITGYELLGIKGADMIGQLADGEDPFNLPRLQEVPTRSGFRRYTIFYKKPGDITFTIKESESTAETFNYHTKVVAPDFYLEYSGADNVPHGEEDKIDIRATAVQCQDLLGYWNGGTPSDNVKYNVSITEGTEYAQLIKKTFDEDFLVTIRDTADSFEGLYDTSDLLLAPQGKAPEDTTNIKIRYSTTDNNIQAIEHEVRVVKNATYPLRVLIEPNILMPGDTADITLEHRIDEYPISDPANVEYEPFGDDQLFNISIEKGSEFGTIYSTEIEDTSDSFYGTADGFYFITKDTLSVSEAQIEIRVRAFIEDEIVNPPIINSETSLQKTSFIAIPIGGTEIFGIGKANIGKTTLDHFEITIIPDTLSDRDTLAFTEAARIFVQAKDADSNNVDIDSTKLLSFSVTTNTNFGAFISSSGDTLKTEPVLLENISYADAKSGKIKFVAVKENPDSILSCNIKVFLEDDSTKNGNRNAVVLEQSLMIVMNGNLEVRPTYFNRNNIRIGRETDSQKEFTIVMLRGNKAVRNHRFRVSIDYVRDSGGHNHLNERIENDENLGYFFRNDNTIHLHAVELATDSVGQSEIITFVASQFGDSMRIKLQSLVNDFIKDSISIIERVPNLEELMPNENYILVGTPNNNSETNDPCRVIAPVSLHNRNHFGTNDLIQTIQNIADEYIALHPGVRIRVNDMSLENGGMFDCENNWTNPHLSHRLGQNVDIGFTGVDSSGDCVELDRNDLRIIITRNSAQLPLEEGNHYHVYSN